MISKKFNLESFSSKLSKLTIMTRSLNRRFDEIQMNYANPNAKHILEKQIIENSGVVLPSTSSPKIVLTPAEEKPHCNSFWHEKHHDQISGSEGSHLIALLKLSRNVTQAERVTSIMNLLNCIKTLNFTFSLFQGLLLGSYRNQSIIPWDQDGDILMYAKDWSKFILTENCLNCPNTTLIIRKGKDSNIVVGKFTDITNGVYVDVWVYHFEFDDMVGLFPNRYRARKTFHMDFIDCTLNGVKFRCIGTPEKYLRHFYGRNFMIPVNIYLPKKPKTPPIRRKN